MGDATAAVDVVAVISIAVIGANGFLGQGVCAELAARGHDVRAIVRNASNLAVPQVRYGGLHDRDTLARALEGASAVVHLAARVHILRDEVNDPLAEYRRVNVDGTRLVARIAAEQGVSEFYFASSVKAMGETSPRAWIETDPPDPVDPYGVSKLEAEHALAEIGATCRMATIPLRLPLVYGPGVRANMLRLFRLVDRGWPLPLGGIDNRRSLVFAGNVGAAISMLVGRVRGHEVFFVSDGHDISTSELILTIGRALGRTPLMVPAPTFVAAFTRTVCGERMRRITDRLFGTLTVDVAKLRRRLGKSLPYTLEDGMQRTAQWYRSSFSR